MNHDEFQDKVIESLAVISTRVGGIEEHLEKLNSKVATQERKNFQRQMDLKAHEAAGKTLLDERFKPREAFVIQSAAQAATSKSWLSGLSPVIWLIAGAVGVMLVRHAGEWLPMLGK
jgi:hypothetical protein